MINLKSSLIGAGISAMALVSYTGFAQGDTKPAAKAQDVAKVTTSQGDSVTINGQGVKAVKNADGSYTITGKNLTVNKSPYTTTFSRADTALIPKFDMTKSYISNVAPSFSTAQGSTLYNRLATTPAQIGKLELPSSGTWVGESVLAPSASMAGGPTTMTANGKYLYICQGTKVYRLDAMTLEILATTDLTKAKTKTK